MISSTQNIYQLMLIVVYIYTQYICMYISRYVETKICIYQNMYISRYVYIKICIYICISSCTNNDQLPLSDSLILTRTTVEFQNPSLLEPWLTHLPFNWNSRVHRGVCPKIGYTWLYYPKKTIQWEYHNKNIGFLGVPYFKQTHISSRILII